MSLKEILEFHLLNTGTFTLTVYHILILFVIFAATWFLLKLIRKILSRIREKNRIDIGTAHAVYQILKYFTWIIAIVLALDTIGIKITFLLAGSAALLVGLGLGLQQIFQDFVSGIAIIIEGTLKAGDIVQTSDGQVGRVKEINMRTSKVETRDNIILIVPNSKLINEVVINWSHLDQLTRFNISVGVAYGSDVMLIKEILLNCAANHSSVSKDPPPIVRFTDFGDSALNFQLLFYSTLSFRIEDVKSDLRFMIDAAFRENNVRIPFPQRDVHLFRE
jgi:small-conductance mechanosensitive channel